MSTRIGRTLTNIDTGETHGIAVLVLECEGGYTYQVFNPTAIFPTADAAADAYAADAQKRYDKQIVELRGYVPGPCCHYCGQEVAPGAHPNTLGVYQCRQCR